MLTALGGRIITDDATVVCRLLGIGQGNDVITDVNVNCPVIM